MVAGARHTFPGTKAVAAGGDTTCALTAAGSVYCWGRNDHGQTGVGSTANAIVTPQRVFWAP